MFRIQADTLRCRVLYEAQQDFLGKAFCVLFVVAQALTATASMRLHGDSFTNARLQ